MFLPAVGVRYKSRLPEYDAVCIMRYSSRRYQIYKANRKKNCWYMYPMNDEQHSLSAARSILMEDYADVVNGKAVEIVG